MRLFVHDSQLKTDDSRPERSRKVSAFETQNYNRPLAVLYMFSPQVSLEGFFFLLRFR